MANFCTDYCVYILNDTLLELVPVELAKINRNDAIVKGLKDGTPLLKEKIAGIYGGMRVNVNNNTRN